MELAHLNFPLLVYLNKNLTAKTRNIYLIIHWNQRYKLRRGNIMILPNIEEEICNDFVICIPKKNTDWCLNMQISLQLKDSSRKQAIGHIEFKGNVVNPQP